MLIDVRPRLRKSFGPVILDWSHPLTIGLGVYVPLIERAGVPRNLVTGLPLTAPVGHTWQPSPSDVGLRDATAGTNGGLSLAPTPDLLSGLSSCTLVSWLHQIATWSGTNESLGFAEWGFSTSVLNRKNTSATDSRCIITLSTTNADLTVTDGMTIGNRYCLAWVLNNAVLSCYINGKQVGGTSTGVGTISAMPNRLALFSGDAGGVSQLNLTSAVGLAGAIYTRALSQQELLWHTLEPYAMLKPVAPRLWAKGAVAGGATVDEPVPSRPRFGLTPARYPMQRRAGLRPSAQYPTPFDANTQPIIDESGVNPSPALGWIPWRKPMRRRQLRATPRADNVAFADTTLACSVSLSIGASASLSTSIQMASAVSLSITASAALSTAIPLASSVPLSITAAGALSTSIPLASAVTLRLTQASALSTSIQMASTPTLSLTCAAALSTNIQMASAMTLSVTVAAALTAGSGMASSVTLSLLAAAALTTSIELASAPILSLAVSAALTTQITLASALVLSLSASAALSTVTTITLRNVVSLTVQMPASVARTLSITMSRPLTVQMPASVARTLSI